MEDVGEAKEGKKRRVWRYLLGGGGAQRRDRQEREVEGRESEGDRWKGGRGTENRHLKFKEENVKWCPLTLSKGKAGERGGGGL